MTHIFKFILPALLLLTAISYPSQVIAIQPQAAKYMAVTDQADIVIHHQSEDELKITKSMLESMPGLTNEDIALELQPYKLTVNLKQRPISSVRDWLVVEVAPKILHIRNYEWGDKFFWQIEGPELTMYSVLNGVFGNIGGEKIRLPFNLIRDVNSDNIIIEKVPATLSFDPEPNKAGIYYMGIPLASNIHFKAQQVSPDIVHFKHRTWRPDMFWEINLLDKNIWQIHSGMFGKVGGNRSPLDGVKLLDKKALVASNNIGKKSNNGKNRPARDLSQKKNTGDSYQLHTNDVVIVLDLGTEVERENYRKQNVPEKNIPILMSPKIRVYLNQLPVASFDSWSVFQVSSDVYQFKNKAWQDFYLQVNLAEPAMYKTTDGVFGSEGGEKQRLAISDIKPSGSGGWAMRMPGAYIELDQHTAKTFLYWQDITLTDPGIFHVRKIDDSLFHLRHNFWNRRFWEIDIESKRVLTMDSGEFGKPGGSGRPVQGVYVFGPAETTAGALAIAQDQDSPFWWATDQDLTLARHNGYEASEWLTNKAKLYESILSEGTFETLLLPVQVDGYAIDRQGRMIITQLIYQRMSDSGYSLPSPILVARALGENNRTYRPESVYKLARRIKAKEIIVPMIGHNGRGELNVRVLKLSAAKGDLSSDKSLLAQAEKRNVPFSDIHLPFMAVDPLLDELLGEVGVVISSRKSPGSMKGAGKGFADSPLELYKHTEWTALESAFPLQLTGVLHPSSDSFAMEGLFVRSLITAWELSPEDEDRSLLFARALYYLKRRPAALEVLGNPKSIEGQALLAYLNGDLVSLDESRGKIKSPIKKMIANIEYQLLRAEYTGLLLKEETLEEVVGDAPEWGPLVARRLISKYGWLLQPNIMVKEMMDEAFPVEGFTAQALATSRAALGQSLTEGSEVELSAYEHYRRTLEQEGWSLYERSGSSMISKVDYLELLYDTSEANLVSSVVQSVLMRGIADEGLVKIRRYEPVYKGHPFLTYLEGLALSEKADNSRGTEKVELKKDSEKLIDSCAFWAQGQTHYRHLKFFERDFPKRYFWIISGQERVSLENSLAYTQDDFTPVTRLYVFYSSPGREKQLNALVADLENRFVGNPDRQTFLSEISETRGDIESAMKYLQQAVDILPNSWDSYYKLADLTIKSGQTEKAYRVIGSFPPFSAESPSNRVTLSHNAYEAAMRFYALGEKEKSLELFDTVRRFESGSGSEVLAGALASLVRGNYQEAAFFYQAGAKRYPSGSFLAGYLRVLHLLGEQETAWAVFDNLPSRKKSSEVYAAALYGLRIEGKTDEEIYAWIDKQEDTARLSGLYLEKLIGSDQEQLKKIYDKGIPKMKNGGRSLNAGQNFMETYLRCRTGVFDKKNPFNVNHGANITYFHLPYAAVYFHHFDRLDEFRVLLDEYTTNKGEDFYQQLAKGVVAGLVDDPESAVTYFHKAVLYILPSGKSPQDFRGTYPLHPLYQLAEMCEWLFDRTKDRRYIDASLVFAELRNQQDPTVAWPYAFVARYAASDSGRLHALGRALYLSPNDARISDLPESEKEKARELFSKNKAFSLTDRQTRDI